MNELAVQDSAPLAMPDPSDQALNRLLKQADAMSAAHKLGSALAATDIVPDIYKGKPGNATAAILYGAELGLSAIQSLQSVFIVKGKPAVYARVMAAQVIAAGHRLDEVEATPQSVTWSGRRVDTGAEFTSTWTIERATLAGYLSNAKYKSNPVEMLRAKCQAELCRTMCPDVLLGLAYSREDLELEAPTMYVKSARVGGNEGLRAALSAPAPAPDVQDDDSVTAAQEATEPQESGEFITVPQNKKLHAMLGVRGLGDREKALDWLSTVLNRDVDTTKTLTADEVQTVFATLDATSGELG